MTFNDEDLKRLKHAVARMAWAKETCDLSDESMKAHDLIQEMTPAAIARLEAAEKAIFASDDGPEIDAWRKASGK